MKDHGHSEHWKSNSDNRYNHWLDWTALRRHYPHYRYTTQRGWNDASDVRDHGQAMQNCQDTHLVKVYRSSS